MPQQHDQLELRLPLVQLDSRLDAGHPRRRYVQDHQVYILFSAFSTASAASLVSRQRGGLTAPFLKSGHRCWICAGELDVSISLWTTPTNHEYRQREKTAGNGRGRVTPSAELAEVGSSGLREVYNARASDPRASRMVGHGLPWRLAMALSTLLEQLIEVEPAITDVLAAAEVLRPGSGSSYRADSLSKVSFLIVEEGFVVIRRVLTERRGVIICHAGAGSFLPTPEPGETLDALVDAQVTLLSEDAYVKLLAHPKAAMLLSDAMRSTLRQKQDSIANFGSVRHVERVQRKLLQLAREHGRVVPDGIRLDFPITHDLLAEMIGSARETVSRAIDRLERAGFLVRDGRSYRLKIKPEAVLAP